jgi:sensor histidine kinase regulating citrate/malate metabolism
MPLEQILLILLGVVGFGFVVYFVSRRWLAYLTDKRIASYQHDLMLKHYAEVENMYNQVRGWRHDYHSHIQAMKVFLVMGQREEHENYLAKLDADLTDVDTVIKSGNIMVDAILNSKISLAAANHIDVNAKASVPQKIDISEIDLSVIIGNLLDNAMEANAALPPEKRFIRLYIGKHKNMLYISVSNAMNDGLRKSGRLFFSTKTDSAAHGFGLKRIDRIVGKYGGFVNRQHEEGVFATEITLPL